MAVQRKEDIADLVELVDQFSNLTVDCEDFQRSRYLPAKGLEHNTSVLALYEAMGSSILGQYTGAVSYEKIMDKFQEGARTLLDIAVLDPVVPDFDTALTKLKPGYEPKASAYDLTADEIFLYGQAFEKTNDPELFSDYPDESIEFVKAATFLAAYTVTGHRPSFDKIAAQDVLNTMINAVRDEWSNPPSHVLEEGAQIQKMVQNSYKQLDQVFKK